MAKIKKMFECDSCAYQATSWLGRCPECQKWNSITEKKSDALEPKKSIITNKLYEIDENSLEKISTSIKEFDRALGGGIVKGSVSLLSGEPGIGKSTLILSMINKLAKVNEEVFYISGEESAQQIALHCKRLNIINPYINILTENDVTKMLNYIAKIELSYLVIDSIQTMNLTELNSTPGGTTQVREVTNEILNFCKKRNVTCFVIGHITKDGTIAGPKLLEHMVDVVMSIENVKRSELRILRLSKNRYGTTKEIGLFEMSSDGLKEINGNYIEKVKHKPAQRTIGQAYTVINDSNRSVVIEIEALVNKNIVGVGKRIISGGEQARLCMLIAIIEKYTNIEISNHDIYVNISGGTIGESDELDVCIIASILSSIEKKPIDSSKLFHGKLSLTGKINHVDMNKVKGFESLYYKDIRELAAKYGQ